MTTQPFNSSDIQRIERGVERINDKVDLVWTGVSELQTKFVRLETESINLAKETDRNKQELELYKLESLKRLDTHKAEISKNIEDAEERITTIEKNYSNLMVKLAPLFLFGTVLVSIASGKIISSAFPTPAPVSQVQTK